MFLRPVASMALRKPAIVPRVHGAALNDGLARKDVQQLRPDVAAEDSVSTAVSTAGTLNSFATFARSVTLLIRVARSALATPKSHLRLMINEHDGAVLRRVEFVVLVHGFVCLGPDVHLWLNLIHIWISDTLWPATSLAASVLDFQLHLLTHRHRARFPEPGLRWISRGRKVTLRSAYSLSASEPR